MNPYQLHFAFFGERLQLIETPTASAVVVALGDVNRFTWTWLPITNPARANQVTWDCLVVWLLSEQSG